MELVAWLRSLTFGGAIGAGVAALLWIHFPSLRFADQQVLLAIGGSAGVAVHRSISAIFSPFAKTTALYAHLAHIRLLRDTGVLTVDEAHKLAIKKIEQFTMGKADGEDK